MKNSDILKTLPLLSEQELKETRALVDNLLARHVNESKAARLCLDVINEALCLRVHYKAVKAPWIINGDGLAYFIDSNFPGVKKVVRVALFKMLIGMVLDNLRARDVPVTFGTVWDSLVLAPQLFDDQFPGYRQNGMCNIIIRAMSK